MDPGGRWWKKTLGTEETGCDAELRSAASVGTSPGYLKYLHQHCGAQQSPAVCRTRVGQFDLPIPLWPGGFIAADVLANRRRVQLLFESYSFLNKSNLVIRLKGEKPLRLTSGYRPKEVSCVCTLT